MRKSVALERAMAIVCLILLMSVPLVVHYRYSFAMAPSYARVGAYAFYSGDGGFVAFLSGVSANISYYVTNVFPNSTMRVFVNASLTLGTEVSNGSTTVAENITDSIFLPKIMPAISPDYLLGNQITFQNVTCTFVKNAMVSVPAGDFNATEFQGKDSNGTVTYFWFDRTTGLALEMLQASSYFQLIQSNIASPLSTQSPLQSELPFILIFVSGWAAAGLMFYAVIRHYTRKAKKGQIETDKQKPKLA